MLSSWVLLLVSSAYLGLLFAVAYFGDRRAEQGRSIINSPYVYTLSIAVYCTAWTFYGSVGRAAAGGVGFLPIYLGPTLMAALWWFVLRRMLRITKAYGITSIADFIASRYGKSALLGGLVTVIALVGIMPYISLQLKAVSTSVSVILDYPATAPFWRDLGLYVALLMAAFSILFGTRHIDATEHHQGMVAAIAFESRGQADRLRDGRPVRDLRHVRRLRRHLRSGGERRARPPADLRGRRAELRRLVRADLPVRARDPVPAAPVPGGGDRERQRGPPHQGDLAVPPVSPGDQPVRPADRARRPAALSGRRGARRRPGPGPADGRGLAAARRCSPTWAACRPRPPW